MQGCFLCCWLARVREEVINLSAWLAKNPQRLRWDPKESERSLAHLHTAYRLSALGTGVLVVTVK